MFKLSDFSILNSPDGERSEKIKPKWNTRSKLSIIPGFVVTLLGISITAYTAFRRGSIAYENAEFDTMKNLNIINDVTDKEYKEMMSR